MSFVTASSQRSFASDNYAGVHPDILRALTEANNGHAAAYGADAYTAQAVLRFHDHFGPTELAPTYYRWPVWSARTIPFCAPSMHTSRWTSVALLNGLQAPN